MGHIVQDLDYYFRFGLQIFAGRHPWASDINYQEINVWSSPGRAGLRADPTENLFEQRFAGFRNLRLKLFLLH